VQLEARMSQQPPLDRWGVLWVEELSQITCTATSAGTAWSMRASNRLNSVARCGAVISVMTLPEATSSEAYRLVIPWRV
jgi:hypothetical protein